MASSDIPDTETDEIAELLSACGWYKLATRCMTFFELALGVGGTALQIGLCILIAVRAETRMQFPAFFFYNAFEASTGIAYMALSRKPAGYFYLYWGSHTISVALAFLALYEIHRAVFRNFYRVTWFKFLFPSVGLAALIIISIRNLLIHASGGYPLFNIIVSLEIAVQFLQIGVLFLFFALIKFFRMRWQQHAVGIALGFGISAAGSLAVFLLRSEFGTRFDSFVRTAPPLAYTVALLVWLLTFLTAQPDRALRGRDLGLRPEEMLAEVRQYRSSVKKMLKR